MSYPADWHVGYEDLSFATFFPPADRKSDGTVAVQVLIHKPSTMTFEVEFASFDGRKIKTLRNYPVYLKMLHTFVVGADSKP